MPHALRNRRIDRVLANVPLHPEVVGIRALVFLERTTLHFVLVRRVPSTKDDFAAAAHGLRIGRHHGNGAKVVEDVFGSNRLSTDARFRKGNVFGDVTREVVAHHQHVEMFVQCVFGVRSGWVCGRGEDVVVLNYTDDVWCMASSRAFGMIGVDGPALEGLDGLLYETRLVQGISMDECLDIVLVTDGQTGVDRCRRATPVFVKFQTADTGLGLLLQG